MIHYPTEKMSDMVKHVASLSSDRVMVSFAPKTPQYVLLKKIGELFPGPSKTTRAYLHPEQSVRTTSESAVNRAANAKDVEHKTTKKTNQEAALTAKKADLEGTQKELDAALAYYDKLKPSCVDAGVSYV